MGNNLVQNIRTLNNLDDNWKVLNFDDVIKDVSSGNVKIKKGDLSKKGNLKVVDQGKKLFAGYTINENAVIKSNSPHIVFGDHTRILKYINFPFAIGADGTKILKIKQNVNTFEKYIYYYFLTLNIPNTGYNRHFKYLKSCKIPIPPIATQKKIAAILDQADKLRQLNQEVVNKYQKLTQSLFLEMFGDPVLNPMGWEKKELSDILEITSSRRIFKNEYVESGIPFYRTKEIVELSKGKSISSELYISKERYNKIAIKNEIPKKGDILLSAVGTIGIMWIINNNNPFYFKDGNLVWLKTSKINDMNPFYLQLILSYLISNEKDKLAQGGSYPALTIAKLKKFKVPIPPLKLQNEFAAHIKEIEIQKEQAQQALAQSENLFNSLLQRAFKGELV